MRHLHVPGGTYEGIRHLRKMLGLGGVEGVERALPCLTAGLFDVSWHVPALTARGVFTLLNGRNHLCGLKLWLSS